MYTDKVKIYDPSRWGAYEKWFAVSRTGDVIAARIVDKGSPWDGSKNVFFYNSKGTLIHSMGNCHGGESGTAFWPDEYHILLPGCDPENGVRDGIKHYRIGDRIESYSLPFDSIISGIWCHVIGASPSGRYVILANRSQRNGYFIDTYDNSYWETPNITMTALELYEPIFTEDEKYVALKGRLNQRDCVILKVPECRVVWKDQTGFLCFTENSSQFLACVAGYNNHYHIVKYDLEKIDNIITTSQILQNVLQPFADWTRESSLTQARVEGPAPQLEFSFRNVPTHACISPNGAETIIRCWNQEVIRLAPDGNYQRIGTTDEIVRDMRFARDDDKLIISQEHSVSIWSR